MSKTQRLHELVVQHTREWAIAHWPEEPVAALGLAYGAGNPPIPLVVLITVAEWDAWLAERDPYGIGLSLWNPGEYGIVDALDVPDEAVSIADELMETRELDEDWFKFMGDVARTLAVRDWSSLPTSPDPTPTSRACPDELPGTRPDDPAPPLRAQQPRSARRA